MSEICPPKVPRPVTLFAGEKGPGTTVTFSTSLKMETWWIAELLPDETLTRDDTDVIRFESKVPTATIVVPIPTVDSNLALLSEPSGWPATKNLCVPIPELVSANTTIFALRSIILFPSFWTLNDTIPATES